MSRNATLSVVIPYYKNKDTIEVILTSLNLALIYAKSPPIQIVFVNNNSNDGTEDKVKNFRCDEVSVLHVTERKQGVSHARNCGIVASSGDYVAFVDADDQLSANYIHLLLQGISLGADFIFIPILQDQIYAAPKLITKKKLLRKVLKNWWCCSFVAKRNCFDGLSFAGNCLEDFGLFPKVITRAKCIAILPHGLYNYLDNPGGLSAMSHKNKSLWLEFQYKNLIAQQNFLDPEVWKAVQHSYLYQKMQYARALGCIPLLHWPQMLKALAMSFRYGTTLDMLRLLAGAYRQLWREFLSSEVQP